MNFLRFTYTLALVSLLLCSSINFHALSHLLDADETIAIEHCDTCDDFIQLNQKRDYLKTPSYNADYFYAFNIELHKQVTPTHQFLLIDAKPIGKHYNKPPPFKLA